MSENDPLTRFQSTSSFVNITTIDDLSEIETRSILSGPTDVVDYTRDSDLQPMLNNNCISDSESESGKNSHSDSEDSPQQYMSTPRKPKITNQEVDADKTPQRSQTLSISLNNTPSSDSILTNVLDFTSSHMVDSNASLKLPSVVVDSYHKSKIKPTTPHEPSTIDLFTFTSHNSFKNCHDDKHLHGLFPTKRELKKAGFSKDDKVYLPSLDVVVFDSAKGDEATDYESYISISKELQKYTRDPINLYVCRIKMADLFPRSISDFIVNQVIYEANIKVTEVNPESVSNVAKGWIKPNTLLVVSCTDTLPNNTFLQSSEFKTLPTLALVNPTDLSNKGISIEDYQTGATCNPFSVISSSRVMPAKNCSEKLVPQSLFQLTIPEFLDSECCVQQAVLGVYIASKKFGRSTFFNKKFIYSRYPDFLCEYEEESKLAEKKLTAFKVLLYLSGFSLFLIKLFYAVKLGYLPQNLLPGYPISSVSSIFESPTPDVTSSPFGFSSSAYTNVGSVTTSVITEIVTVTATPAEPSESNHAKSIVLEPQREEGTEVPKDVLWNFKVHLVLSEGDHDEPLGVDLVFPVVYNSDYRVVYDFTDYYQKTKFALWYDKLSEDAIQLVIPRKNRSGNVFGSVTVISSGISDRKYISINYGKSENTVTENEDTILAEYKYDWRNSETSFMNFIRDSSSKLTKNLFKGSAIVADATQSNIRSGIVLTQKTFDNLGSYLQCDFFEKVFQKSAEPSDNSKACDPNDEKTNIVAVVSSGSQDLTESLFWAGDTILNFFLIVFGHIYSESENIIREIGALLSNSVDFTEKSFQKILQASYNTVLDAKQSCNVDKPFQYLNKAFSKKPGNLLSSRTASVSYAAQAFDTVGSFVTSSFKSTQEAVQKSCVKIPSWDTTVSAVEKAYENTEGAFDGIGTFLASSFKSTQEAIQNSGVKIPSWDNTVSTAEKNSENTDGSFVKSLKNAQEHITESLKESQLLSTLKEKKVVASNQFNQLKSMASIWASKAATSQKRR